MCHLYELSTGVTVTQMDQKMDGPKNTPMNWLSHLSQNLSCLKRASSIVPAVLDCKLAIKTSIFPLKQNIEMHNCAHTDTHSSRFLFVKLGTKLSVFIVEFSCDQKKKIEDDCNTSDWNSDWSNFQFVKAGDAINAAGTATGSPSPWIFSVFRRGHASIHLAVSVCPYVCHIFEFWVVFCITAPAQPSTTVFPCIQPCRPFFFLHLIDKTVE